MTLWIVAGQAPLSVGFSRQAYWSGLPCPPPGDLPKPGIKPRFPALQMDSLPSEPPGKPFSEDAKLSLGDRVLGEERIALLLYQVKGDTVGSFPWKLCPNMGRYGEEFLEQWLKDGVADKIECVQDLHSLNWASGGLIFMSSSGSSHSSVGKESACDAWDLGSIPGLGRSPGGRTGNPLQYSCLENPHGQRRLAGYNPWGHKSQTLT